MAAMRSAKTTKMAAAARLNVRHFTRQWSDGALEDLVLHRTIPEPGTITQILGTNLRYGKHRGPNITPYCVMTTTAMNTSTCPTRFASPPQRDNLPGDDVIPTYGFSTEVPDEKKKTSTCPARFAIPPQRDILLGDYVMPTSCFSTEDIYPSSFCLA